MKLSKKHRARTICHAIDRLEPRRLLSASLVKDIFAGTFGSNSTGTQEGGVQSIVFGNRVLFGARDERGVELWSTDGTAAGTTIIQDINDAPPSVTGAPASSTPSGFIAASGRVYFGATTAANGRELWVTDGTAAGTHLVADVNTTPSATTGSGTLPSNPSLLAVLNDRLYFHASGDAGTGIYRTNATDDGVEFLGTTGRIVGSRPSAVYDGRLYFAADDSTTGNELRRTTADGTGIELVADLNLGAAGSSTSFLTPFDGKLYFSASTPDTGIELWSTDGTTTQIVHDLIPGANGSFALPIAALGDRLFVSASTPETGTELYQVVAGTNELTLAAEIMPGAKGSSISTSQFAILGDDLIFHATNDLVGGELFRYDPQSGTATNVTDVSPAGGFSNAAPIGVFGQTLFFRASDGLTGSELYQTGGTPETTFRVADLYPGLNGSNPTPVAALGNAYLLYAGDPVNGSELWRATPDATPPLPTQIGSTLTVNGTSGDDTFQIGQYADGRLYVQLNGRTLAYGGISQVNVNLGAGNDLARVDRLGFGISVDIDGGEGFDSIRAYGTSAGETFEFDGSRVSLDGSAWIDRRNAEVFNLYAQDGNDTLRAVNGGGGILDAGAGDDLIDFTAATIATSLFGNSGNDTFYAQNRIRDGIDGGAGTDTAYVDADDGLTAIENAVVLYTGRVAGTLFEDQDGDGVRDAGEPGLAGWTVRVTGPNGTLTTLTDQSGGYAFANLKDGAHTVSVPLNFGYQHAGATTNQVIINGGNQFAGVDFAATRLALVGGYAFDDANLDGVMNAGEAVLPGSSVYWDANANGTFDADERGDVADANGWYQFGLPPNTSGYLRVTPTGTYRATTGYPIGVNFYFTGAQYRRIDFAATRTALVTGQVYIDADRDGVRDAGEIPGMVNTTATVFVDLNGNGVRDTGEAAASLDGSGSYSLLGVPAGTHTVRVRLSNGNYASTDAGALTVTAAEGQVVSGKDFGVANTIPPQLVGTGVSNPTNEGAATTFTLGTLVDWTIDGPWSITLDFGDGTTPLAYSRTTVGDLGTVAHAYADSGAYVARLTVVDGYGGSVSVPMNVTVANVAPTLAVAAEAATIPQGGTIRVAATATDASPVDAASLAYRWTISRDGVAVLEGTGPTASYTPGTHGTFAITFTASDKDGGTATASTTVVVTNPPPTVTSLVTPTDGVRGQRVAFAGTFADAGPLSGHTVTWDFGDGSTLTLPASDANALAPTHAYAAAGSYNVTLRVTDDAGGSGTLTKQYAVAVAQTQRDPRDASKLQIAVGGTSANDLITFATQRKTNNVEVKVNNTVVATFAPTNVVRIVAYGQGGNDTITMSLAYAATFFGGAGNDTLNGGNAADVLVGGDGADSIVGGNGRDVLIGGAGADRLDGGNDDDIVVGGATASDDDLVALLATSAGWQRTDLTYASRVSAAYAGAFSAGRAYDDLAIDTLIGGRKDQDWFLAAVDGVARDALSDRASNETVTDV